MIGIWEILVAFFILVVYGSIIAFAIFLAYHLISAARTLKEHSKQQTELLHEIKSLLERIAEREEPDDVV